MALVNIHQSSFNAGEISPEMLGRVDDPKQTQGLETCLNFICTPQGPVENRAGTEFVRAAKYSDKPTRVIAFNRGSDQSMCLELGEKYIRFHTQRMTLLKDDGTPYEVETPYTADEVFDINFMQSIDVVTLTHPNHPPMDLKRYGIRDWRLEEVVLNNVMSAPTNVQVEYHCQDEDNTIKNKTAFDLSYVVTACDEKGEKESVASTVATVKGNLYINSAYARISWDAVENAKIYKVYKNVGGLYGFIGQTEETQIDDDNISADNSITVKYLDDAFGTAGAITAVEVLDQGSGYYGTKGVIGLDNRVYVNTFQSGDSNGPYVPQSFPARLYERAHKAYCTVDDLAGKGSGATATAQFSYNDGEMAWYITGVTITNKGKNYVTPRVTIHVGLGVTPSLPLAYVNATAESETGAVSLVVTDTTGSGAVLTPVIQDGKIVSVKVVNGGSNYTEPEISVQSSEGSGAEFSATVGEGNTYPSSVTRFEQRRIFAGSTQYPHHIWMTRNGTEDDMSYRLPVQDDDRISVDMAVTDGGAIRHIVATTQLMILTEGGEYRVTPINSDAITPTSMNIRPQSFVGSSKVQPVLVNSNVIYVAARGGHVRELGYSYQAGGYVSGDICLRAAHLFDHYDIKDLAYQKAPYPILWATSTTGDLLSACYIPEQAVLGWSKQRTYMGEFESVAVVPEGNNDYVYVVVNRMLNGQRYRIIECMRDRNFPSLEDAFLVDCGLTFDKRGRGEEISEVTGLSHLEGCTVAILGDGAVFPNQIVTDGKIKLDPPVKVVHVGLPIESKLTTLPVRIGVQDGTMGRGRRKKVNCVWARVLNSSGVWVGPKGSTLVENKNRTTEPAGTPPALKSSEIEIHIPPSVNTEGQIEIEQRDPLPLTLLALTQGVDLSE